MEFELNEILDIIDKDIEYWCTEKMKDDECNSKCKYFTCNICWEGRESIDIVRELAAACFGSTYEKND